MAEPSGVPQRSLTYREESAITTDVAGPPRAGRDSLLGRPQPASC
jgi:hypothetical protein